MICIEAVITECHVALGAEASRNPRASFVTPPLSVKVLEAYRLSPLKLVLVESLFHVQHEWILGREQERLDCPPFL